MRNLANVAGVVEMVEEFLGIHREKWQPSAVNPDAFYARVAI
jgi:hypothetical protein